MIGVKIDLRINGRPVRVQSEEDVRKLRDYLDDLIGWAADAPRLTTEDTSTESQATVLDAVFGPEESTRGRKRRGPNPAIGHRVIDYIVRALQLLMSVPGYPADGFTLDDLHQTVKQLGWEGSEEPEKAKRVLIVTARKYQALVSVYRGRLLLTPEGQRHLKGIDEDDPF